MFFALSIQRTVSVCGPWLKSTVPDQIEKSPCALGIASAKGPVSTLNRTTPTPLPLSEAVPLTGVETVPGPTITSFACGEVTVRSGGVLSSEGVVFGNEIQTFIDDFRIWLGNEPCAIASITHSPSLVTMSEAVILSVSQSYVWVTGFPPMVTSNPAPQYTPSTTMATPVL